MATITVKNIPNDLYDRLKKTAEVHRRSINNEIIYCIENSIKRQKIDVEQFIQQIDKFYENLTLPELTDEMLKKFKTEGRL